MIKQITLLALSITFGISSFAQGVSYDETVDFINELMPSDLQVRIKKEREMFVEYTKGGEVFRSDRVYMATLDANQTSYSEEEDFLILRCNEKQEDEWRKFSDGCVERTFPTKGKIAAYQRLNMKVNNDPATLKQLTNAFNHLIRMTQDEGDYMGVDSFE